ncbi:MAG: bifunctional phosphoribosylaminoimidazolecarboxamide formyltransferase/IMP cyclohydrolase [Dehalococcoidia bacterium]
MRAIISVSDKRGVVDFARGLSTLGVEIFSSGGTQRALEEGGLAVKSVSELTGFPEILDGRVKTLHPAVHGGILARRDIPQHLAQLAERGIRTIDMVVVNLYPFVETVSREGVTLEEALENIDIGGPTLIRAAAKNFPHVLVVVDSSDYSLLLEEMSGGEVGLELRKRLAQKAFQHVALYDTAIARYLNVDEDALPLELTAGLVKLQSLRYGENPHQSAAFYKDVLAKEGGIPSAKQLWGKELSFNNILDADAAWRVVTDFDDPTVAIIKHTNPCGLASHEDLGEAYRRALAGDPVSAFGGIVAINRPLTLEAAEEIAKTFYEIILAPDYAPQALERLKRKKDLRILSMASTAAEKGASLEYRRVAGGFLVQTPDDASEDPAQWKPVTQRHPTPQELADLAFAWRAAKHVKSNAIVIAKDGALLGMGAGQPNRVVSVHLALRRAEERAKGAVLASDAFFPFADGVELAGEGGVTAIVQPGGSIRDQEVIDEANKHNIAMVFTGTRHFRH